MQEEIIDTCILWSRAVKKSEVVYFNDGALEALENNPWGTWRMQSDN